MTGALPKPDHIFDRDREWRGLARFAAAGDVPALGVVSGRRRQGKSYLLQALVEAAGGMYFPAIEATEAESLRLFTDALVECTGAPVRRGVESWSDAIPLLFERVREPVPVVIDEFPFLVRASPSLPSIIQRELGPGGSARASRARLLLCGSAMSVMGGLLAGQAPLRGRAGLELVVHPFDYRDAARFWGLSDPRLAVLVHAVVGGTPAYRREFVGGDAPTGRPDFDRWVCETVLNPQTPLFREARYMLAEETEIRDPALYHSVLTAVALGHTRTSRIASYIGRKADHLAHPLNVLEDCGLLTREPDLFRPGRSRFRVVEPLVTFYHAIMRSRWAELERGRAEAVWSGAQAGFRAQVVGPHFEALAREFALRAGPETYGELPAEVGSGVVNDATSRSQIEVDVVVMAAPEPDRPRRVLSLGEVKWGERMGRGHVGRLARARDLLATRGFDTSGTVLACYGAAGFDPDLDEGAPGTEVILVDPERMYG